MTSNVDPRIERVKYLYWLYKVFKWSRKSLLMPLWWFQIKKSSLWFASIFFRVVMFKGIPYITASIKCFNEFSVVHIFSSVCEITVSFTWFTILLLYLGSKFLAMLLLVKMSFKTPKSIVRTDENIMVVLSHYTTKWFLKDVESRR